MQDMAQTKNVENIDTLELMEQEQSKNIVLYGITRSHLLICPL